MHCQSLVSSACLIGAGLMLCGPARAADDAAAGCNATNTAYLAAVPTGDPAKMAAVYAPDGELVTPWGLMAGRDAIIKYYASYMKAGDKQTDTLTSLRIDRRRRAVHRHFHVRAGLGRRQQGQLDESGGKGGRRVEDSESDLQLRRASVGRADTVGVHALAIGSGGASVTTCVAASARAGSRRLSGALGDRLRDAFSGCSWACIRAASCQCRAGGGGRSFAPDPGSSPSTARPSQPCARPRTKP